MLDYHKPPFWIIGAVAVIAALIICLCSNPGGNRSEENCLRKLRRLPKMSRWISVIRSISDEAVWTQEEWDIYAEKLSYVTFETRSISRNFIPPSGSRVLIPLHRKGWYVKGMPEVLQETTQPSGGATQVGSQILRDYQDPVQLTFAGKNTMEYEAARQYQLYGDDQREKDWSMWSILLRMVLIEDSHGAGGGTEDLAVVSEM